MSDDLHEKALAGGCPHAARAASLSIRSEAAPAPASPQLFTINQVESLMADDHPLRITASWMRRYLGRPHRDLGRPGPVCPFVPGAIVQDTIWLADCSLGRGDRQAIIEIIGLFRDLFLDLEPKSGEDASWKAMVIVFPNIAIDDAWVVDDVQAQLKARFVDAGLMIGEFHERNESPGLRNGDFRPLRSPIPALAIRHMVETDLPFLQRTLYPPPLRAEFIRSYLRRLGAQVSRNNFDAALDALVTAEIEIRTLEEVPS
jgi:uncharacterized protein DUF6875